MVNSMSWRSTIACNTKTKLVLLFATLLLLYVPIVTVRTVTYVTAFMHVTSSACWLCLQAFLVCWTDVADLHQIPSCKGMNTCHKTSATNLPACSLQTYLGMSKAA